MLLKLLISFLHPESGKLLVDGEDIAGMSEHHLIRVRRQFGMLFLGAALLNSLTVLDNIAIPITGKPDLPPGGSCRPVQLGIRLRASRNSPDKGLGRAAQQQATRSHLPSPAASA